MYLKKPIIVYCKIKNTKRNVNVHSTKHYLCVYCLFKKDCLPGHQIQFQVKKTLIRYSPIRALKSPNVSHFFLLNFPVFLTWIKR